MSIKYAFIFVKNITLCPLTLALLSYTSLPLFLSLPVSVPTSTPDYIPGVDLGRHKANLDIQATALDNFVTKEEWQEPIALSPVNGTIEALEGDDVEIWCVVHGTPLPEIRWTRENGTLLESDRVAVENNGKTLRIKNAQLNDEVSYVCVAANGVGTLAVHSVSLEVYGKYRQCNGMFELDKGNLEIEPSNSTCLSVIKLQNTIGFRLELDPLVTEPILVVPEQTPPYSNIQFLRLNGSSSISHEFNGKSLAVVVPPGRQRTIFSWKGLALDDFGVSYSTKFVKQTKGKSDWERVLNGTNKVFWAFNTGATVKVGWSLNTTNLSQDKENTCERISLEALEIRPDGNISKILKTCNDSSKGFAFSQSSSQILMLLHLKSFKVARSSFQVKWGHPDDQ